MDRLLQRWPPPGPRVLELGADADTASHLAARFGDGFVAVDLAPDAAARAAGVRTGDANRMPEFDDASFDAVITTSMFEHDRHFWRSLAEIRRVLAPGGRLYVEVPGYASRISARARYARAVRNRLNRRGWHGAAGAAVVSRAVSTRTYPVHMEPHDYYRFSAFAVEHVLFEGLRSIEVREEMDPPRLLGVAEQPATGS
jgi:SAM-dependent methyltransferase